MSGGMSGEWRYGEGWINTDQLNSKAILNGAVARADPIMLRNDVIMLCCTAHKIC